MKYIALHSDVMRCRPEPPLGKLHNDCGAQDRCARRLAANTNGDRTRDWSKQATPYGIAMMCSRFIAIEAAAAYRDTPEGKPMQEPT